MRPSSSAFSEADPSAARYSPTPTSGATGSRYRPLRQVIGVMDLDILAELDRFRHWQQAQTQGSTDPFATPSSYGERSYLRPQEVVEDLEEELDPQSGNFLSSLLVLLLWLLSCSGIGLGLWWLISPGEPERLLSTFAPPSPSPLPPLPDLDALPLIRPGDLDPRLQAPVISALQSPEPEPAIPTPVPSPALDLEGVEVQQIRQPSWLDLLQQERSQFGTTASTIPITGERSTVERSEVASSRLNGSTPVPTPTPISTPTASATPPLSQPDPEEDTDPITQTDRSDAATTALATPQPAISLGPQGGEGTYLVLLQYQGEGALARARQVSSEAFLRTINGQQFIQLAAFRQLEHARYMADDLRRQGFAVQVIGG